MRLCGDALQYSLFGTISIIPISEALGPTYRPKRYFNPKKKVCFLPYYLKRKRSNDQNKKGEKIIIEKMKSM